MEFKRENWKDIERYFHGTWVKFQEYGDTLFYISRVRPDHVAGTTDTDTEFLMELHDDQPYVVEYVLPHRAVFQYGNRAAMIRRIPAKQYRRGLCSDNTSCFYPDTNSPIDIGKKVLQAYTNKAAYSSFTDAFHTKSDKRQTIALSPRMWARRSTGEIYMDLTKIAEYIRSDKKLVVINPKFLPELTRHSVTFKDSVEIVNGFNL